VRSIIENLDWNSGRNLVFISLLSISFASNEWYLFGYFFSSL